MIFFFFIVRVKNSNYSVDVKCIIGFCMLISKEPDRFQASGKVKGEQGKSELLSRLDNGFY